MPHRTMFWQIDHIGLFYLLAALAVIIFLTGLAAHLRVWIKGAGPLKITFSKDALGKTLMDTFLGRRALKGEPAAGVMHLSIFWGFLTLLIGTGLLAVHDYLVPFLKGYPYLLFSAAMEIAGLLLLSGLLWAFIRRYGQRVPRLERRLEDALVPAWILVVAISGFMVEGFRLSAQQPSWQAWSFAGGWLGALVSAARAEDSYCVIWWLHALLSLGLIAAIPFTKMFHILGAPAAIYFQGIGDATRKNVGESEENFSNIALGDAIFFDACMGCGRCVAACPSAGAGEPLAPREFVQAMRLRLWQAHSRWGDIRFLNPPGTIQDDALWYCTTCRACLEVCPVYSAALHAVMTERISAVEAGTRVPTLLTQTLEKVFKYDNPWESSKSSRGAWAEGLGISDLTRRDSEADLCYFVGCTTSFDDTAKGIARSFSTILQTTEVNFGILGKKEPCCGDIARSVGETGLFGEQQEKCRDLFEQYGIGEVVASSPHCFHTFRNHYPEATFRVRHYTQVLLELIANGKLRFAQAVEAITVTYHDPCYLGRYNGIYAAPREVLRAIPGLRLVEMAHHGGDSLCCGGGGGRMWNDLKAGQAKIADIRIREAAATGANIVVTACPLCRIMLEDARKAAGLNEILQVMDLNELVVTALVREDARPQYQHHMDSLMQGGS